MSTIFMFYAGSEENIKKPRAQLLALSSFFFDQIKETRQKHEYLITIITKRSSYYYQ